MNENTEKKLKERYVEYIVQGNFTLILKLFLIILITLFG